MSKPYTTKASLSAMTRHPFYESVKSLQPMQHAPFVLLDVGCCGGLHDLGQYFAPNLVAYGFDLEKDEIARLNQAADKPQGAAFFHIKLVGPHDSNIPAAAYSSDIIARSSGHQACTLLGVFSTQHTKQTQASVPAIPDEMTLDEFAQRHQMSRVDFIKTDTDGFDYHILKGASGLLGKTVLGLQVECAINGAQGDGENLWRNTDKLLQAHGFSLFDTRMFRYSRAALPRAFEGHDPAQTEKGQISWCDAFYFRDIGAPDYEERSGFIPTIEQILKQCALFEYFGFPDCAAEILIKYKTRLDGIINVDAALNLLTPQDMGNLTYAEYMAVFNHMIKAKQIYPFGRIKLQK